MSQSSTAKGNGEWKKPIFDNFGGELFEPKDIASPGSGFEFVYRINDVLRGNYRPGTLVPDSPNFKEFRRLYVEVQGHQKEIERLAKIAGPLTIESLPLKAIAYLRMFAGMDTSERYYHLFDEQIGKMERMRGILEYVVRRGDEERKTLEQKTDEYITQHELHHNSLKGLTPGLAEKSEALIRARGQFEKSSVDDPHFFDLERTLRTLERDFDQLSAEYKLEVDNYCHFRHAKEGRYFAEKLHRTQVSYGKRILIRIANYVRLLKDTKELFGSTNEIYQISKLINGGLQEINQTYNDIRRMFIEGILETMDIVDRNEDLGEVEFSNNELRQLLDQVRQFEMKDFQRLEKHYRKGLPAPSEREEQSPTKKGRPRKRE